MVMESKRSQAGVVNAIDPMFLSCCLDVKEDVKNTRSDSYKVGGWYTSPGEGK
jgi:hypothetical protein